MASVICAGRLVRTANHDGRPLVRNTLEEPAISRGGGAEDVLCMRAGLLLLSTGAALGARTIAPAMSKANLPSKTCVVCNRPFTWRKKWERCWDEVSTCSKRCNGERRSLNQRERKLESVASLSIHDAADNAGSGSDAGSETAEDTERAARKAAKKAVKEKRKATRAGVDPTHGQKPCTLCSTSADLLIRCQIDSSGDWQMVCGRCWKLPTVANGVVDGDGSNPHYKYGGLWKNLHAAK